MRIPRHVIFVMLNLMNNGYQAYLVGGSVRDCLLGKLPKDYDVATTATPDEVAKIFDKVVFTGEKFGTVTVIIENQKVEVTTLRCDSDYSDGRRPDRVFFTTDLKEDVSRRDFTINSLAMNTSGEIYDFFGGMEDLKNKIIKAVGNPSDRFKEDGLRILRAIRFACCLGFSIEENTFKAMQNNAYLIKKISAERIRDELCRILLSDKPSYGIELMRKTGLLEIILPELYQCVDFDQRNPNHDKDVYRHTLVVLDKTPARLNVRLAALLHDIGKPVTFTIDEEGKGHFYSHHIEGVEITEKILRRLKFDNKTIDTVKILVREHMSRFEFLRTKTIKKFITRVGVENLKDLFDLQIADIKGSAPPHDFTRINKLREEVEEVLNNKEPLTVKDLDINGYDLIELGVEPGPRMGKILNYLLEKVLENPELNQKDKLKDLVLGIM